MSKRSKNRLLKVAALALLALILASFAYVVAPQSTPMFHGVGILKTADSFAAVNDTVTYRIMVYNPSSFNLLNTNVTDNLLKFNATIPFMAAGNTTGVTYTLNRTVLASDPDPLINTVSVKAIDSDGVVSTASTQAKTAIVKRLLEVNKTGPSFAHEGDTIRYTITAKNIGTSLLSNVTLKDETLGFGWKGDLAASEVNVFNLTYVVPENAEDPLTNKVTAFAKQNQTTIYGEGTWTVDILHPKIDVEKTVTPCEVFVGENVTYKIVTTNTGDADLFNLTIIDSMFNQTPASLIPKKLEPGESVVWQFNATINRYTENKVKATAVDILGMKVTDRDKAIVKVKPRFCPKSMGYWKNHPEEWPVKNITVGNMTYTKEEALSILNSANAKDATNMLTAQLIVAKLNRISGASPYFRYCEKSFNIDDIISRADAFLTEHPYGSNPQGEDRQKALWLKDILDAYNNSGEWHEDHEWNEHNDCD